MPRDGSLTLRDLIGRLDLLRVECAKCDRRSEKKRRRDGRSGALGLKFRPAAV